MAESGNFDDLLKAGASMAVRTLLADPVKEEATQQSDRVGGAVSVNVAAVDQSSIRIRTGLNAATGFQDDFYSQSFSSQTAFFNPGRLVVLKTAIVDTSRPRFTDVASVSLPMDFYVRMTQPAFGQSRFFAAVRTGFYFRVHVNVASGVAGALLVYYVPKDVDPDDSDKRSLTMFPHSFVNFGTNAVAELMIPYVNDTNFSRTDTDDLGHLKVCIWSKARVPSGVSTSITVQILGAMRQVDFQNPRPIPITGQWQVVTRNKIDIAEGPGSMNLSNVNTTGLAQSLSLGMEETRVDERTVGAKEAIEDFLVLLKIPVPIGTQDNVESGWFNWEVSATPGTSIYQSYLNPKSLGPVFLAFCNSFSYWRGTLQLTITVFATPFNKGRLRICFFPNATSDFDFQQADNALNVFMDIGLDSSVTFSIPFSAFSWLRTTSLNEFYGRLQIFVANELQTNLNAPNSLEGQITLTAGSNFEFIAPITRGVVYQGPLPDAIDSSDGDTAATAAGLQSMENVGGGPEAPKEMSAIINYVDKKVSVVGATHTRADLLFGRAMFLNDFTITGKALRINLNAPNTGTASLLRLVSYFTGKVVIHIFNATDMPLMAAHTWENADSYPFIDSMNNHQLMSALGSVVIPSNSMFSLEAPYYNERPFRVITFIGASFGNLLVQPVRPAASPAIVSVWISLHDPKFFFPRAIRQATIPTRNTIQSTTVKFTPEDGVHEVALKEGGLNKDHLFDEIMRTAVRRARKHVHNNLPQPVVCCMCLYVSDSVKTTNYNPLSLECKRELRELESGLNLIQTTRPFYWARVVNMYNNYQPKPNPSKTTSFMQTMKLYWPEEAEDALVHFGGPDIAVQQKPDIMYLVKQNKGLYDHYGIHFGDQVIQLQSENPLDTILSGTADIVCTPYDNTWTCVDEKPANGTMWAQIRECVGDRIKYGISSNCETLARFLGAFPGVEQGQVISAFLGLMVSCAVVGLSSAQQVGGFLSAAANMAKSGWTAASDATIKAFSVFTTAVLSTIQHSVKRTILRVIIEFGCLAILYCGNPTLLSTTALATIVMLRMSQTDDLPGSVRAMVTTMMEGDLVLFAGAVSDVISEHATPEDKHEIMRMTVEAANDILGKGTEVAAAQGLKEFNAVSMGARHVDWWASKMVTFFQRLKDRLFPSRKSSAIEWLEANVELALQLITEADDVVVKSKTASTVRSASFQKRLDYTLKKMQALRRVCVAAGNGTITSLVTQLCVRLTLIPKPCSEPTTAVRVEPIGVWITGEPGVGKSWFSSHLQSELAKQLNRPLHVYTQCTSSEYFDGYNGQWLHYVDDFGQTREEKDVANMVNLISARHFPLPMADVQDKGYWYTSDVVMVTTNKSDFRSSVLSSESALSRRFPIRIHLCVKKPYDTGEGFLNVPQAMKDGSLEDGSCWTVNREKSSLININLREVCDMKKIATGIVQQLRTRIQVTKTFNDRVGSAGVPCEEYLPPDYSDIVCQLRRDGVCTASPVHAAHGMDHLDLHFDVGMQSGPKKYMTEKQLSNKPCEVIEKQLDIQVTSIEDDISFLGSCEDEDWELECLTTYQKIKIKPQVRSKFETALAKTAKISAVLKPWQGLITSICSVLGAVAGSIAIWYYVTNHKKEPKLITEPEKLTKSLEPNENPIIVPPSSPQIAERAYSGIAPRRSTLVKPLKAPVHAAAGQSAVFNNGWAHCMRACMSIRTGGSDLYGVVCKEHSFLFYDHGLDSIGEDAVVHWNGLSHPLKNFTVTRFSDQKTDIRCELVMITMNDCPWRFKDMTKHFGEPMDGGWGKLCYSNNSTYASYEVSGIKHISTLALMEDMDAVQRVTNDPFQILREHIVTCVVRYYFQGNAPGSCGGLLIQKQNGQYKLVGMHISGNPNTGLSHSTTFLPYNKGSITVDACQGVVVAKRPAPMRAHVSSKTKIVPSPFHGLTPLTKQPAVLHPRDARLQIKMENCLKENAEKYGSNQYIVEGKHVWAMEEVKIFLKRKFFSITGFAVETTWDEAVNGMQHSNPIDMSTSPGVRYVQQHKTKRDLFEFVDGRWIMQESFFEDVKHTYQNFKDGVKVSTLFGTNLKDELRKTLKIYEGKTRVIEACSVDYVVVYRRIMGQIYDCIYNTPALSTGIAVGIDPLQDYHDLWCDLTGHLYTIDYKQFDGNLPAGVMRQAVEILSSCHEDPDLVKRLHEPIITSTHLVMDEEWDVEGGMPSGAPCTSVLNSLSNLVMVLFCLLNQDVDPECVQIVTYGDDVLFTTQNPIDAVRLTEDLKYHFGMTATNATKDGPIQEVPISQATFLKRNFCIMPGTSRVVGLLDLETCLQNIQWCKSIDDFKQQFQSWTPELMLHGQELYSEVRECCREAADALHIYFPTWEEQQASVKHRLYNNG